MNAGGATSRREKAIAALVYLAATALVAWWYVDDLRAPLVYGGDTNQYEYASFHLAEHLRWTPWPQLQLVSDAVFYPYGVKHVFETWAFEQNYFTGFLWRAFGPGPWIKWHWLAGLWIGAWGTYLLARTRVGFVQALVLGFMASYANYYLFIKYPDHICYAACHWTTLAILCDSLLTRSILVERRAPLRMLLLRGLLTVLSLGHDLAYTAGISLTSLTVHAAWLAGYGGWRCAVAERSRHALRVGFSYLLLQARRPGPVAWAIVALTLVFAFLYVPLAAQLAAASVDFPHEADQERLRYLSHIIVNPTSPLRIAVPYFPSFNPRELPWAIADDPELPGIGSVGWALLSVGLLGLVVDRRRWMVYVPLVALLAMFLTFSPAFSWLRALPWFRFARVCGRGAGAYPAILIAMSLGCVWRRPQRPREIAGAVALAAVLVVELAVGHQLADDMARRPTPPDSFWAFQETIRNAPGAAVLDWPFTVAAGSGSYSGLDAYYTTTSTASSYRRFHGKKCVGHYFGRLLPTQVRPFLLAGWDRMLMPDVIDPHKRSRQRASFDAAQWRFFSDFYFDNDFCGIVLYIDRLAPGDEQEFYRRFGEPVAETETAWAGRMAFIRKTDEQRRRARPERGPKAMLRTADVYDVNGSWALAERHPKAALQWFERAVKLDPNRWTSLAGMAQAYEALQQPALAEQYLRRATIAKAAADAEASAPP